MKGITSLITTLIILIVLAVVGYFAYKYFIPRTPGTGSKACSQEAKLCPNGSYVGRTGPNCEFAPCP